MKKQMGFRIDKEMAKELNVMLAKKDITFQEYIVELIKKDMDKENE